MGNLLKIIEGGEITLQTIIENAAEGHAGTLQTMNDHDYKYFEIGFIEGIRIAAEILQEIAAIKEK